MDETQDGDNTVEVTAEKFQEAQKQNDGFNIVQGLSEESITDSRARAEWNELDVPHLVTLTEPDAKTPYAQLNFKSQDAAEHAAESGMGTRDPKSDAYVLNEKPKNEENYRIVTDSHGQEVEVYFTRLGDGRYAAAVDVPGKPGEEAYVSDPKILAELKATFGERGNHVFAVNMPQEQYEKGMASYHHKIEAETALANLAFSEDSTLKVANYDGVGDRGATALIERAAQHTDVDPEGTDIKFYHGNRRNSGQETIEITGMSDDDVAKLAARINEADPAHPIARVYKEAEREARSDYLTQDVGVLVIEGGSMGEAINRINEKNHALERAVAPEQQAPATPEVTSSPINPMEKALAAVANCGADRVLASHNISESSASELSGIPAKAGPGKAAEACAAR